MIRRCLLLLPVGLGLVLAARAQPHPDGCSALAATSHCKLIDDFESTPSGTPPNNWKDTEGRDLVPLEEKITPRKNVYVRTGDGNQFARMHTEGKALRAVHTDRQGLNWDVQKRPYLRWTWRAKALPEGANEKHDRSNDTGGAVYATFSTDWLGRPKSIKYTYSTSLPVGTTVDYGPLKVLVVASKKEQGTDTWITHERNVVDDYKRLFGDKPDNTPRAVTIWSDSDTMKDTATVDYDNIMLLSQPAARPSTNASPE